MDKIKILVAPSDHQACDKYRCSGPHLKLKELNSDFKININYKVDWTDTNYLLNYDILHLHAGLYENPNVLLTTLNKIKNKIYIIVDADDYWVLPENHEAYQILNALKYNENVTSLLKIADCVIASTKDLAKHAQEYNLNVFVIPNAVDFTKEITEKNKSDRIRFGLVGSRSHYHDYLQLRGVTSHLLLDKCQFVLCGFKEIGCHILRNGRLIKTDQTIPDKAWSLYEKLLTNDYKILDPEYAKIVQTCKIHPNSNLHPYKRLYEKDINNYLEFYKDIDVLLAPLMECEFNNCKSNLKFLEAAQTNTAVIATNTGPFKEGLDIRYNENGNCILTEPNTESWTCAINTFIEHPELIELSKKNLRSFIKDNYNLEDAAKYRGDLYKQLLNNY